MKCTKCDGEGRVANSENQEPWSVWAELPPGSDLAVKMGLVKPITCPECHGVGTIPEKRKEDEQNLHKWLRRNHGEVKENSSRVPERCVSWFNRVTFSTFRVHRKNVDVCFGDHIHLFP